VSAFCVCKADEIKYIIKQTLNKYMSKRIFTEKQIKELLLNPNVADCSEKSVTYSKGFKLTAVKRYREGLPPHDIFREAEINLALVGRETPKWCIKRWLKIFKEKGEDGLQADGRGQRKSGGRPKGIGNLSDEEKLKYLEAENAYLKAENSFLAKLRKKS